MLIKVSLTDVIEERQFSDELSAGLRSSTSFYLNMGVYVYTLATIYFEN